MKKEIEIEAKYLLSKESFNKIVTSFNLNDNNFNNQTNYYLDTNDLKLSKVFNSTLRVRKLNNTYQLTFKYFKDNHIVEHNKEIEDFNSSNLDFIFKEEELLIILFDLNIDPKDIKLVGSLKTSRASIKYLEGELFFDISTYGDCLDYEIEYEVTSSIEKANEILLDLFKNKQIEDFKPSIPKVKRAIKNARLT